MLSDKVTADLVITLDSQNASEMRSTKAQVERARRLPLLLSLDADNSQCGVVLRKTGKLLDEEAKGGVGSPIDKDDLVEMMHETPGADGVAQRLVMVVAGGDQGDAGLAHAGGQGEVERRRWRVWGCGERRRMEEGETGEVAVVAMVPVVQDVEEEEESGELGRVLDEEGALALVDAIWGATGGGMGVWVAGERAADGEDHGFGRGGLVGRAGVGVRGDVEELGEGQWTRNVEDGHLEEERGRGGRKKR